MSGWATTYLWGAFWVVAVLAAACFLVVALGPKKLDRVLATDMALILVAVDLGLFSALDESAFYMDTALLIAIISYLVTVVLARQLESGEVLR
ncbi:MAG TPA: monovalent cation/H+ antiporter complex subunit F [Fredinandcohnia sp.]|nr:monovalent cation/H+ antiporter complex subunit F [Fredinandcohnia sp.]